MFGVLLYKLGLAMHYQACIDVDVGTPRALEVHSASEAEVV